MVDTSGRCRGFVALVVAIGLFLAAVPHAAATVGERTVPDPYFPELGNEGYDVLHYKLAISAVPGDPTLSGEATITARATTDLEAMDLDLVALTVSRATIDGQVAHVTQSPEKLHVAFDHTVRKGAEFDLRVVYGGTPTTGTVANTGIENGWLDFGSWVVAFGEPDGARRWFPANDHPSDKASFEFQITAPSPLVAVANGHLVQKKEGPGTTTYVWDAPDPMATYLAVLAIGHYTLTEAPGVDGVTIRNAVPTGSPPSAAPTGIPGSAQYGLGPLGDIITFFEHRFGEFPFDEYGVIVTESPLEFAFESQTFTLGSGADAHELAHQWFGDSVTPRTWRDIWLAEGFATYADWLWRDHTGEQPMAQSVAYAYSNAAGGSDIAPRNPGRDHMFSSATYERGALFLHALNTKIGDARFFRLLRTWTKRFGGKTATTTDFLNTASRIAGRRLDRLFDVWLNNNPLPATGS